MTLTSDFVEGNSVNHKETPQIYSPPTNKVGLDLRHARRSRHTLACVGLGIPFQILAGFAVGFHCGCLLYNSF